MGIVAASKPIQVSKNLLKCPKDTSTVRCDIHVKTKRAKGVKTCLSVVFDIIVSEQVSPHTLMPTSLKLNNNTPLNMPNSPAMCLQRYTERIIATEVIIHLQMLF